MRLSRRHVNVGDPTVSFFAVDHPTRDQLVRWLTEFRTTTPSAVRVDIVTTPKE
jgi:hypothetical protein